jgi:hypothetical protein
LCFAALQLWNNSEPSAQHPDATDRNSAALTDAQTSGSLYEEATKHPQAARWTASAGALSEQADAPRLTWPDGEDPALADIEDNEEPWAPPSDEVNDEPPESVFSSTLQQLQSNPMSIANTEGAIERAWALGIDLNRQNDGIAALTPLLESANPHTAALARQAIEDLLASRDATNNAASPAVSASPQATTAYVMELQTRALTDPDPLARLEAIAELGDHAREDAAQALEMAVNDSEPENRVQAVASLGNLAAAGIRVEAILSRLQAAAQDDTGDVANAARAEFQRLTQQMATEEQESAR